jgi:hypothetical protein
MLAVDYYQHVPDLFFLTQKGAEVLVAARDLDLHEMLTGSRASAPT